MKSLTSSGSRLFQIVPAEPNPWTSTSAGLESLLVETAEVMLTVQLWMRVKDVSYQKLVNIKEYFTI